MSVTECLARHELGASIHRHDARNKGKLRRNGDGDN